MRVPVAVASAPPPSGVAVAVTVLGMFSYGAKSEPAPPTVPTWASSVIVSAAASGAVPPQATGTSAASGYTQLSSPVAGSMAVGAGVEETKVRPAGSRSVTVIPAA